MERLPLVKAFDIDWPFTEKKPNQILEQKLQYCQKDQTSMDFV